jgi:hypothetical protein
MPTSRTSTILIALGLLGWASSVAAQTGYHPVTPSQFVACKQVDTSLSKIPQGDGDGTVTDAETGPGGWRYNRLGRSFVTFAHTWDGTEYDVVAGRSGVGANGGIINDYPATLDLLQASVSGQLVFKDKQGEIVLTGDTDNDPPLFRLPGKGAGQVRIVMTETETPNVYEGCAMSPLLKNFGFLVQEGGDFVQREFFKAYAETDDGGNVTFFEWTEVSTFKNVNPAGN